MRGTEEVSRVIGWGLSPQARTRGRIGLEPTETWPRGDASPLPAFLPRACPACKKTMELTMGTPGTVRKALGCIFLRLALPF